MSSEADGIGVSRSLLRSTLSSKYGHVWIQKNKMALVKIPNSSKQVQVQTCSSYGQVQEKGLEACVVKLAVCKTAARLISTRDFTAVVHKVICLPLLSYSLQLLRYCNKKRLSFVMVPLEDCPLAHLIEQASHVQRLCP